MNQKLNANVASTSIDFLFLRYSYLMDGGAFFKVGGAEGQQGGCATVSRPRRASHIRELLLAVEPREEPRPAECSKEGVPYPERRLQSQGRRFMRTLIEPEQNRGPSP